MLSRWEEILLPRDQFGRCIENILNRVHEVGIHPGKTTFHNKKEFAAQVNRLREIVPQIKGGRQHYLLYDMTETLRW